MDEEESVGSVGQCPEDTVGTTTLSTTGIPYFPPKFPFI